MLKLPKQEVSYWEESASKPNYPALSEDIEVDVAIVGGGITGLTCAYLLTGSGLKVAVLEKNTIGYGTTGGTTGKVTSQHGLVYDDLVKHHGKKTARLYGEANQLAIDKIEHAVTRERIDCGWERDDNYVFTTEADQSKRFKAEAEAAASLGLPATYETKLSLPFEVAAAVRFADQAKFNAQKYVLGLADIITRRGGYVFERSNVAGFRDGKPATIRTSTSNVRAKDIIVATKVPAAPLIARFSYGFLEYPTNSYIIASRYAGNLKGMHISPDKGQYSILPISDGEKQLLLIGGEHHIPGLSPPARHYRRLGDYAEKYFGFSSVEYKWRKMDYIAYDEIPLIGKVYPWSQHLYTATGFKKWGLSTSMVAGIILHDLILGRPNPWADAFTSVRVKPIFSIPRAAAKILGGS